jgi:hypothetical protein
MRPVDELRDVVDTSLDVSADYGWYWRRGHERGLSLVRLGRWLSQMPIRRLSVI